MRTIMARSPHDSSLSFSRRHFPWIVGKVTGEGDGEAEDALPFSVAAGGVSSSCDERAMLGPAKKKKSAVAKLGSAITAAIAGKGRANRVTGTLYGHRRGHVHFAFQFDSKGGQTVLIELAMPTSALVREMASGLVRIALECERRGYGSGKAAAKQGKLLEETLWRGYCNGKKCGYGVRRECGEEDWKVLRAVEKVSMGAGVLPAVDGAAELGEMMYMRAKFERVVGSKDSEAFYMLNPDGNSGPELSIYLLRV